jgi:CRISPR-associated protein Cas5h
MTPIAYFTYNNIHKPALLGLFGAIIGLGGHIQLYNENRKLKEDKQPLNAGYPEFYEKLHHLKVSIAPLAPNGYFSKKIQVFNNSVGYASQEMGGNLIVREQWLENPSWQIMILEDESEECAKLRDYLLGGKSVFVPYLGKNDHPAKIDKVEVLELENPIQNIKISSLIDEESLVISKIQPRGELSFYFKEVSPIKLQEEHHFYEYTNLIFTNHKIEEGDFSFVFSTNGKNYAFI